MRILFLLVFILSLAIPGFTREAKEYDHDVIYDEDRIPSYRLPDPLIGVNGERVETAGQWHTRRRPEILSLFSTMIYGQIPVAQSPIETTYEVVSENDSFMGGLATRKDIRIRFSNDKGEKEMHVLVFVPNDVDGPAPALLKHSFNNTQSDDFDEHPENPDTFRNGWPMRMYFERGFGFIAVYQQDLVDHNEVSFGNSIHKLFYEDGQSFPYAHQWGCISAIAWGAMRALDYLETDDDIDHTRVAVMGHSKMGKTALWTAALDQRFALAISAQSGCAGAALWRRKSGETLEKMVTRFPYWLSRNAWKFVHQEADLPVDQHMLLGLIAPRPVYIASAIDDTWADPRGEFASGVHAGPVYELLGKRGLPVETLPPLSEPILESEIGFHIRAGGHSVELEDWQNFLRFMEIHMK